MSDEVKNALNEIAREGIRKRQDLSFKRESLCPNCLRNLDLVDENGSQEYRNEEQRKDLVNDVIIKLDEHDAEDLELEPSLAS